MTFSESLKEFGFEGEALSLQERETVYSAAYGMYEVGDYERAAGLFTELVLNEPFELRFWQGLASCRQMNKEYKAALHAWSIVCLMGGQKPISHFHAAECYLSLGDLKEASKALQCAQKSLPSSDPLYGKIEELKAVVGNG